MAFKRSGVRLPLAPPITRRPLDHLHSNVAPRGARTLPHEGDASGMRTADRSPSCSELAQAHVVEELKALPEDHRSRR